MSLEIRPYREEDTEACRALWVQMAEHHREIYNAPGIGGDDPGSKLDEYLASPNWIGLWVAVDGGDVVGLVGLQHYDEGTEIEIEPIITDRSRRAEGIGQRLIERAAEETRAMGKGVLNVRVAARNASAMSFYRESGFRTIGLIELMMPLKEPTTEWQSGITINDEEYDF